MAILEYKTGTATIGTTEYSLVTPGTTLASDTTKGVYQVFIDTANMAGTDEFDIEIKEKVTSAGSQRIVYSSRLQGPQGSPFVTPSLILMHGWDVTIQKATGTDRSFSWSIRKAG